MWKAYSVTGNVRVLQALSEKPNEPAACIDETKIRIDKQREYKQRKKIDRQIDREKEQKKQRIEKTKMKEGSRRRRKEPDSVQEIKAERNVGRENEKYCLIIGETEESL